MGLLRLASLVIVASTLLIGPPNLDRLSGAAPVAGAKATPAELPLLRSKQSGPWSAESTWEGGKVPGSGARVQVREGHRVVYDVTSDVSIRVIHVAGTLTFATDRDTRLDVGLIKIQAGEDATENGFDCEAHLKAPAADAPRPALEVGTPNQPVEAKHRALIRLVHFEGMDKETCPAIVCCGGRMDLHGAPMAHTWVKLDQMSRTGEARIVVPYPLDGWNVGDRLIVTGTTRQVAYLGTRTVKYGGDNGTLRDKPSTEERIITKMQPWPGGGTVEPKLQIVSLDKPLTFEHRASGEYRAEVANLSRNVVVESADPEGVRGHTMYHRHSAGSISYAEFRHLGKEGVLGKYPIHYHLCGDTMRGSSVIGASIWHSGNRWLTIHGTQYLVVRDCVGYDSIGHGFFLEDGTEVFNVLDHNLAVMACRGKPLPKQLLPYDQNLGSGFWWANNANAFTRNVATECDQDGFRLEVVKSDEFDPVLPILRPDGKIERTDVRKLPFVCFSDNEAHTHRLFAVNLGGFSTLSFEKPSGDIGGAGPEGNHPLILRNLKVWDAHWGFHTGVPNIMIDGADFFDCAYGLFRCVLDGHVHSNIRYVETRTVLHFPRSIKGPAAEDIRPITRDNMPVDDFPPITVVTHVRELAPGTLLVRGTTTDNYGVKRVVVNDVTVRAIRPNFAEWEVELHDLSGPEVKVTARGEDGSGNVEARPHVLRVPLAGARLPPSR